MPGAHIALLRGVNVGGRGLLPMADLRALLADLGLANPRTLLQSGNAVFKAGRRMPATLETLIAREILTRLSLETDVFVRTSQEWRDMIRANPFAAEAESDPAHLIVMTLRDEPTSSSVAALRQSISGPEVVQAKGPYLYLVYPSGMGPSKLTGNVIERKLGTRGTARNWNTVRKLAAMVESD